MTDNQIVRAAIHPVIGVARVGNSEQEFFVQVWCKSLRTEGSKKEQAEACVPRCKEA